MLELLNCCNLDKQKLKFPYVIVIAVLYAVSFIFVTVGFFTPVWYTSIEEDHRNNNDVIGCSFSGLVSGDCRYPFGGQFSRTGDFGYTMRVIFFLMLTAMVTLYFVTIFLIIVLLFKLEKNQVVMTFTAILFGVFYPVATIFVLVASIFSATMYSSNVGYSLILSLTGGSLMLVVFIMVVVFVKIFKKTEVTAGDS